MAALLCGTCLETCRDCRNVHQLGGQTPCARTGQLPPARADHVTAMWHYCDCGHWKDILVVHGGSSAAGLLGDVWTYDVDTNR